MSAALHPPRRWQLASSARHSVSAAALFAGYCLATIVGATQAAADIGDLGPAPTDPEIRQTLADLYTAGQPTGTQVDVRFDGPIMVGPATERESPTGPWCATCGPHDAVSTPMYPVYALVRVTTQHGLETSALSGSAPATTTVHAGAASCTGGRADCAYYFYRDGQGNWQTEPLPS